MSSEASQAVGIVDLTSGGRGLAVVLAAFAAIAVLAGFDLLIDLTEGTTRGHVLMEGAVVLVGMVGAAAMARKLIGVIRLGRLAREEAAVLAERLKVSEEQAARWRAESREVLAGLGAALDRQFERWALSPAEKEVALLLLKGLSHKEVATARDITEATARQQARAVYKKAGLSGRNDLAAFFLEDLLLPR